MVLASLTSISQSCAGDYSVPAQAPLARKMLRHLLPTQLRVWERDRGQAGPESCGDTGASHGRSGKTSRRTRCVS